MFFVKYFGIIILIQMCFSFFRGVYLNIFLIFFLEKKNSKQKYFQIIFITMKRKREDV